ncbi:hypothetical protein [Luteimicrobium subarcticum]|uniref:ATP/GTP-binding protein n=1 Tax=Luteimicrobium subarcticum TaxID=620910 RepID=A0A2M8W1I2_9MICO|nr:hypothetical protein [Luteimicrobium subarcticum]PJI84769.1 hypothetical protein CLV34_3226 [Luteimicrobium subarcticum]
MPTSRRSRRHSTEHRPLDVTRARGGQDRESGPDGEWNVRSVRSGDKSYTCPGCRQTIPPGTPHLVTWRADDWFGAESAVDDRRHWHTSCWQARGRRR